MSRTCPEAVAVGGDFLLGIRNALHWVQYHMTDPEPKIVLRAVAELTKLLAVCARYGIALETEPKHGTGFPPSLEKAATGQQPQENREATPSEKSDDAPPAPVASRRRETVVATVGEKCPPREVRVLNPTVAALPPPDRAGSVPVPLGGKALTSFLGPAKRAGPPGGQDRAATA